jgi:hypothetical protein
MKCFNLCGIFVIYFIIQCIRKVAVHLGYDTVRYVGLVVSIAGGVEMCCCFAVFSC